MKQDGDTAKQEAQFDELDEKALASILLCVKASEINLIKNCDSSKEAWDKLAAVYKPRGPARKITLFRKLLRLSLSESACVQNYINDFVDIVERLKEIDMDISEDILTILMPPGLGKKFENFVVAIETREQLPTLSDLKVKIIEEGERQRVSSDETELCVQQAFVSRPSGKGHKKNRSAQKNSDEKKNKKKNAFDVVAKVTLLRSAKLKTKIMK